MPIKPLLNPMGPAVTVKARPEVRQRKWAHLDLLVPKDQPTPHTHVKSILRPVFFVHFSSWTIALLRRKFVKHAPLRFAALVASEKRKSHTKKNKGGKAPSQAAKTHKGQGHKASSIRWPGIFASRFERARGSAAKVEADLR